MNIYSTELPLESLDGARAWVKGEQGQTESVTKVAFLSGPACRPQILAAGRGGGGIAIIARQPDSRLFAQRAAAIGDLASVVGAKIGADLEHNNAA